MEYLGVREIAGFFGVEVDVHCTDGKIRKALVYSASKENECFIGPTKTVEETAEHILNSTGPSGPNIDYVMNTY